MSSGARCGDNKEGPAGYARSGAPNGKAGLGGLRLFPSTKLTGGRFFGSLPSMMLCPEDPRWLTNLNWASRGTRRHARRPWRPLDAKIRSDPTLSGPDCGPGRNLRCRMDREYTVPYIGPPIAQPRLADSTWILEKNKVIQRLIGGSSNGRTTDSDSVNLGSNPSPPAS